MYYTFNAATATVAEDTSTVPPSSPRRGHAPLMCSASPQCQQYARPAAEAMAVAAPKPARNERRQGHRRRRLVGRPVHARRSGDKRLCAEGARAGERDGVLHSGVWPLRHQHHAHAPRRGAKRQGRAVPEPAASPRIFFRTNHHASSATIRRREHDHQRAVPDAGGGQHVIERAKARGDGLVLIFLIFFVPVASFVFATANTANTANTEARDARRPPPQTPQALLGELRGGGGGGARRRTALRATAVSGDGPPRGSGRQVQRPDARLEDGTRDRAAAGRREPGGERRFGRSTIDRRFVCREPSRSRSAFGDDARAVVAQDPRYAAHRGRRAALRLSTPSPRHHRRTLRRARGGGPPAFFAAAAREARRAAAAAAASAGVARARAAWRLSPGARHARGAAERRRSGRRPIRRGCAFVSGIGGTVDRSTGGPVDRVERFLEPDAFAGNQRGGAEPEVFPEHGDFAFFARFVRVPDPIRGVAQARDALGHDPAAPFRGAPPGDPPRVARNARAAPSSPTAAAPRGVGMARPRTRASKAPTYTRPGTYAAYPSASGLLLATAHAVSRGGSSGRSRA